MAKHKKTTEAVANAILRNAPAIRCSASRNAFASVLSALLMVEGIKSIEYVKAGLPAYPREPTMMVDGTPSGNLRLRLMTKKAGLPALVTLDKNHHQRVIAALKTVAQSNRFRLQQNAA